jgi:hypothetical protein
MTLKIELGDYHAELVTPPTWVELCWRTHILDTLRYDKFCRQYASSLIHYDVFARLDTSVLHAKIEDTVNAYFNIFACWPVGKFWEFPTNPKFALCCRAGEWHRNKLSLANDQETLLPDSLVLNSTMMDENKTVFLVHVKKPPFLLPQAKWLLLSSEICS